MSKAARSLSVQKCITTLSKKPCVHLMGMVIFINTSDTISLGNGSWGKIDRLQRNEGMIVRKITNEDFQNLLRGKMTKSFYSDFRQYLERPRQFIKQRRVNN